jgi:DNA-binding transcriptional MerR regulator
VSTYRISELAKRTGIPASTLRFYEQAGLLPALRTASNYRIYDEAAVARLEFIGSAKLLGLPLEEIRELLSVWEKGVCGEVRHRLRPLVAARIAEAQRRIAELSAFVARLGDVHEELGGPVPLRACGPGCGCVPGPVLVDLAEPRRATGRVLGGSR